MEIQTAYEDEGVLATENTGDTTIRMATNTVDTAATVDTMATVDTSGGDPMGSADRMGSGDATSVPIFSAPIVITLEDTQDMIFPDPSIINLLPPLIEFGEPSDSNTSIYKPSYELVKYEGHETSSMFDGQEGDEQNFKLSPEDISKIHRVCAEIPREDHCDTMFDLSKLELLFRCEACQDMPISSESVHTCDFGHQVCGYCYTNGVRTCLVCKGHLMGNNVPLENVLRRLREKYPHMFRQFPLSDDDRDDISHLKRFYSLKPIICPQSLCTQKTSVRGLLFHFEREHPKVPIKEIALFHPYYLSVPVELLENTTGIVIAALQVAITEKKISSKLATDSMVCWVQGGAIYTKGNDKALALWVSCAYEEDIMPPILFSFRATTANGYFSFGGEMTPLLDYKNPQSILDTGKCLLLFPNDIKNILVANKGSLLIEVKFYLR